MTRLLKYTAIAFQSRTQIRPTKVLSVTKLQRVSLSAGASIPATALLCCLGLFVAGCPAGMSALPLHPPAIAVALSQTAAPVANSPVAPLQITTSSLPAGVVNLPYHTTVGATGRYPTLLLGRRRLAEWNFRFARHPLKNARDAAQSCATRCSLRSVNLFLQSSARTYRAQGWLPVWIRLFHSSLQFRATRTSPGSAFCSRAFTKRKC